jgi:uncharacterized membrane protein YkgB
MEIQTAFAINLKAEFARLRVSVVFVGLGFLRFISITFDFLSVSLVSNPPHM